MPNGNTITIPANHKVTKITVRQDRAENAEATFKSDIDGRWQTDGSTGYLENGKSVVYPVKYPQLFGPAEHPFNIQVDGSWMWGGNPQGMPKVSYDEFPDHFSLGLFSGAGDPYADLIVEIWHAK